MLLAFLCLLSAYAGPVAPPTSPYYTPLDEYVARPDSNYRYEVHSEYPIHGKYWKGTILKMYSQQWLTPSDWNRGNPNTSDAIWWHWMTVVVPDQLDPKKSDHGVLWITGGSNNDGPPDDPTTEDNGILASLCMDMGVVGAALYQVPNQPIYFPEDPSGQGRTEDAFIAWTWHHFIFNTSDVDWPARLPMTKAAVRAMDTLADFRKDSQNVTKFIVSGASKRGWTTWTAGLTDDRVVLIIPIVLDALHLTNSLHHMWRAYGGWTFAFQDYYNVNLTAQLDTPQFAALCRIEDPYNYLSDPSRLNMPKLVINAVMDEFLQGDNDQFWWDRMYGYNMTGTNFRLMCPDAEHSEITGIPEIMLTIAAWGNAYFQGVAWPRFNWTINDTDGTITFINQPQYGIPINVSMWYAPSFHRFDGPYLRDWRIAGGYPVTLPQVYTWRRDILNETAPGSNTWIARQPTPAQGWNAFYIEAYYYGPKPYYDPSRVTTYRFTTQISIVPKYKWYVEDCYDKECYGTLV